MKEYKKQKTRFSDSTIELYQQSDDQQYNKQVEKMQIRPKELASRITNTKIYQVPGTAYYLAVVRLYLLIVVMY